ncbi:hypothetical protein K8R66_02645 [bacterium]|nr:hypothetical protein [bacterium]
MKNLLFLLVIILVVGCAVNPQYQTRPELGHVVILDSVFIIHEGNYLFKSRIETNCFFNGYVGLTLYSKHFPENNLFYGIYNPENSLLYFKVAKVQGNMVLEDDSKVQKLLSKKFWITKIDKMDKEEFQNFWSLGGG